MLWRASATLKRFTMVNKKLRINAEKIYTAAIREALPDRAVERALGDLPKNDGRLVLVAIGKAAWQMANAASRLLGERITEGIVITKYDHSQGEIPNVEIYEAAHPVPDENGLRATERALELTSGLSAKDIVLFLVSGGGSALFEAVDCTLDELRGLTSALLSSGASISEINTVRKHLSNVKGGRFAAHCAPASVYAIVLSDVIGNRLDMIASGPTAPDGTTVTDVEGIIRKYNLQPSDRVKALLKRETPKTITNATHLVSGSVSELCASAKRAAESLGYESIVLTDSLTSEASETGKFLGAVARYYSDKNEKTAIIAGGETVVHIRGGGKGGRNQEIALSASIEISGLKNVCVFSVGSDGTDGPTDAAGGYADGDTAELILASGRSAESYLSDNDSYMALALSDGLIFTGATGTNVNDISVILIEKTEN